MGGHFQHRIALRTRYAFRWFPSLEPLSFGIGKRLDVSQRESRIQSWVTGRLGPWSEAMMTNEYPWRCVAASRFSESRHQLGQGSGLVARSHEAQLSGP